ncbi:D-isomer specific 2-hydroxyacid dehydrogenase [Gorgonomyces haynaldii]|nr:D-isomer specific 2-hydroxyacid dehydrogenase [Gorgonomyces haynaldii]
MGIPVFTAPYQHQTSVSEMVISYIVLLARQIGDRSREIHTGEWNKTSNNCHEVRGKTLGLVGYGHCGSQLGVMAEALSLRVIFYDVVSLMPIGRAEPVSSLNELLEQADYVVLNISKTPENNKLFGKEQFQKMKSSSYFINVSYGDAVDEQALADALKSGHLAGAALDTVTATNGKFESPLVGLKNVILTPGIASYTIDSFVRIVSEVCESIVRYIKEGTTTGAVNFPSVAGWKLAPGNCRILCIHYNVRGVLREIDHILSTYNVGKQILDTKDRLGYLIADVKTENVSTEIVSQLAMLANTIRTRIIQ